MERPVGDKFKINGCVYVVVEDSGDGSNCDRCAASNFCGLYGLMKDTLGSCLGYRRSDRKNVHFEHFGVNF